MNFVIYNHEFLNVTDGRNSLIFIMIFMRNHEIHEFRFAVSRRFTVLKYRFGTYFLPIPKLV